MLRAAFSTLQVGARIRKSLERSLRQAVALIVAVALLFAAAIFGLLAAYHALVSAYQFDAAQAATIMAAGLMLVGLIVLAIVPLIGRQPKRASPLPFVSAEEGPNLVDRGLGKAMQQIGPVPLIAIAFIAGILAGRR